MKYNTNTYTTSKSSIVQKWAMEGRLRIFKKFCNLINQKHIKTILDVGVTADKSRLESNFFELLYPDKDKITALSNQDASWMEKIYPGLKFIRGDAREMPFQDNSFDLVFSSAVIEHVGNTERQELFLKECIRVSKKYIFITTPNRWHPVEFHSVLPLIHWLPKHLHRTILKLLGHSDLAKEENLNLLDKLSLQKIYNNIKNNAQCTMHNAQCTMHNAQYLFFWL